MIFLISDIQESLQTQKLKVPTPETTAQTATELLNVYSDDEYIRKIQKRLEEDTFAREQREKRRRKMLVEQLIAHEAQEVREVHNPCTISNLNIYLRSNTIFEGWMKFEGEKGRYIHFISENNFYALLFLENYGRFCILSHHFYVILHPYKS